MADAAGRLNSMLGVFGGTITCQYGDTCFMVILKDRIYHQTKGLLLGQRRRSKLLADFCKWMEAEYSVRVANFQLKKAIPKSDRLILNVIMVSTVDHDKMHEGRFVANRRFQQRIANRFRQMTASDARFHSKNLDDLSVTFTDFSAEARTEANWKTAPQATKHIKSTFKDVWNVQALFETVVVFYNYDEDIRVHEQAGQNDAIRQYYFSLLKTYDDLDYYSKDDEIVKFDSKENLDVHYQGSLFYYMR